ncbi:MAG: hypothetical protein NXH81_06605 [Halieaceae bacterium]|uniref:hypothetical protein n=1 Tax=Haliea alexandrii TaxID=2448162 RepID=UPI001304C00D|nr:hypothetical protein [Haliea alexandrii]MCR9185047.1 hypothetical protein [Halieaceae bacterium]
MSEPASRRGLFLAPLAVPTLWIVWTVVSTDWSTHEYFIFALFVLVIGYLSALIVGGIALAFLRVLGLYNQSFIVGVGAVCGALVLQGLPFVSGGFSALSIKTICLGALLGAFTAGVYCWLTRITS